MPCSERPLVVACAMAFRHSASTCNIWWQVVRSGEAHLVDSVHISATRTRLDQSKGLARASVWVQLLSADCVAAAPFMRVVAAASFAQPLPWLRLMGTCWVLSCENLQFAPKVHRPLRKCLHCCCWLDINTRIASCWTASSRQSSTIRTDQCHAVAAASRNPGGHVTPLSKWDAHRALD